MVEVPGPSGGRFRRYRNEIGEGTDEASTSDRVLSRDAASMARYGAARSGRNEIGEGTDEVATDRRIRDLMNAPVAGEDSPGRRRPPLRRRMAAPKLGPKVDAGPSADDLNQAFLDKLSRQKIEDEAVSSRSPMPMPARLSANSGSYGGSDGGGGGMKKGGLVKSRGDGIASRGKTRGKYC